MHAMYFTGTKLSAQLAGDHGVGKSSLRNLLVGWDKAQGADLLSPFPLVPRWSSCCPKLSFMGLRNSVKDFSGLLEPASGPLTVLEKGQSVNGCSPLSPLRPLILSLGVRDNQRIAPIVSCSKDDEKYFPSGEVMLNVLDASLRGNRPEACLTLLFTVLEYSPRFLDWI